MRKYNYSILKLSLFLIVCFTSCKNEENKKTNEEKTTVLTQEKTTETETDTFVWESELCTNTCTFDKSKIKLYFILPNKNKIFFYFFYVILIKVNAVLYYSRKINLKKNSQCRNIGS